MKIALVAITAVLGRLAAPLGRVLLGIGSRLAKLEAHAAPAPPWPADGSIPEDTLRYFAYFVGLAPFDSDLTPAQRDEATARVIQARALKLLSDAARARAKKSIPLDLGA